ncbi:carbohydrate sulfotransferase 1 isoform X2 [Patella vulgata]|nr:carbohydrate sulfotransferase 1 isoform X2 [Patella vulgata]
MLCVFTLISLIYFNNNSAMGSRARLTNSSDSRLWQLLRSLGSGIGVTTHVKDDRKRVILVTYPRGGSTFTADVIQANSDVFFIFEPLYPTLVEYTGKDLLITDNGIKKRIKRNMTSYTEEVKKVMKAFLNCDSSLFDLPLYVLKSPLLRVRDDTSPLYECAVKIEKYNQTLISHCVKKYIKSCEKKKIILVKTIRYPSEILYNQMKNDPNLYVVYLMRDPRGIISSQMTNFQNFEWKNINRASKEICTLMEKDIQVMEALHDLYPDRVKLMRYESIAFNPLGGATDIYKFLELNLTKNVTNIIKKHTKSNETSCSIGCTVRKNSKSVPYKWRVGANFKYMQKIDRSCGNVYTKMCYVPVDNIKQLKNASFSLIKPCPEYGAIM